MLDGYTVVYKGSVDLFFYVIGSNNENPVCQLHSHVCTHHPNSSFLFLPILLAWLQQLILASVLNCLFEATTQILRKNVEKRNLLDNLDVIFLAVDEICDGGYA